MARISNSDVFLLVADETEEFQLALRYGALAARRRGVTLAIMYVMDKQDFQHWGNIESRMYWEQRHAAEKILWLAGQQVYEMAGVIPAFYLEEGGRPEVIMEVLAKDTNIRRLILGAGIQAGTPGPLVSYFTGKGLASLPVPLTIIPGGLSPDSLERLI